MKTYNLAFCNEWAVNTNDTAAGLPGILYGRYPGDSYAGRGGGHGLEHCDE